MSEIDNPAAGHLLKVTAAAQLLGARCVLTGVRASLAMTLASIGIDLGRFKTFRNLRAGLADCVQSLSS
jgi:rsbT co-antagonist protein RsbR